MTPFILFSGIIIISLLIPFGIWFYINRYKILSFFQPDKYVWIEMLELDNSISEWIQPKNPDLRFEFNKGYYNMYHQSLDNGKMLRRPAIYRDGRLAKFFYHEGHEDPMDFRQGAISGNPQINRSYEETNITALFDEDMSVAEEFFRKYGLWIVLGILIIVIIMFFNRPEQAVQQIQTVKGG